jgi:hypothetical protein
MSRGVLDRKRNVLSQRKTMTDLSRTGMAKLREALIHTEPAPVIA